MTQTLITVDSRGRMTLPRTVFKHRQYMLEELADGSLLFTPVPGTEVET